MFYNFQKVTLTINGQNLVIDDAQLTDEIELKPKYVYDNRVSETMLPNAPRVGNLKLFKTVYIFR